MLKISILGFVVMMLCNCAGVKPYQKEYLLSPLMDDGELQSLSSDFRGNYTAPHERLSSSGMGGSAGSSCPTCGG